METEKKTVWKFNGKLPLKVAIVGGGRACNYFLGLLRRESFTDLKIEIIGVCDINPEADGFRTAKKMGIYTTDCYHDFFKIKDLDGILELTNSNQVLLDLIQLRPTGVGILEHNIGRLLRNLFQVEERLKSAEQQVQLEKAISDFLIQQANDRIVVLNTDFTISEANAPYLESSRKPKSEVIGKYCYDILYGLKGPCSKSRTGFGCPMVETLRTGESVHLITEDPAIPEETTYSEIVTYPVKNAEGDVVQVIEIWRDITEAMSSRWEKRIREVKADLNKLVQEDRLISLGKLVASCVHEVNNPIQGLLTFSSLIKIILEKDPPDGKDLQDLRSYVSLMSGELERCGEIISGLLSFSRESVLEICRVDLNEVLETVITLIRHKLQLQDISLKLSLSPNPLCVRGDANQLQQCFINLVFNAIEAMAPGGQLSIVSRSEPGDGKVTLIFEDTGYGIAEEHLAHIFDPFFSTKEIGEGTGLGLSIVYGVVKSHDGNISVESKVGEGSRFVLRFPGIENT